MVIVFSIIMGMLATGAILGLCYLFYTGLQDTTELPPVKASNMPPTTLRFKKPNL